MPRLTGMTGNCLATAAAVVLWFPFYGYRLVFFPDERDR